MKKHNVIIGCAIAGVIALVVIGDTFTRQTIAARPVRLVVTGAVGERFSGSYVADGITNSVVAAAPAAIALHARDVTYEFKREGGAGEFRVALYVGDLCRLSTTSGQRQGVRGELRYAAASESYWAAGY